VLGGNKKFGDTWKLLSWTFSGKMGGLLKNRPSAAKKDGHGHSISTGRTSEAMPVPPAVEQEKEAFRIL